MHLLMCLLTQERIRNLCVMAHVDHGKTSLSDHLIGANGLIHPKLQVRASFWHGAPKQESGRTQGLWESLTG